MKRGSKSAPRELPALGSSPERIPSGTLSPDPESGSLHEIMASCSDMEACGTPRKSVQYQESEAEPGDTSSKVAKEVVSDIVGSAMRAKLLRRKKKPKFKSGWMQLEDTIHNFDIDDETFKSIMFAENLLVSTFEGGHAYPIPVGAVSVDVQAARGGPLKYQNRKNKGDYLYPKFLVHLSSQIDFLGHNGGSRITSWVDRDLQTLEEKRREYLKLDDTVDQQALYVSSQENYYYLRHDKKKDIFYSPEKAKNLICEGANLVLMRYLAVTRYVGSFELSTLYINGSLCRNIYDCKGPSSGVVNNVKLDVCKIYRTIIEECGVEHKCVTLMTLDGQILKQEWGSCNYILQINPLLDLSSGKLKGPDRIPLEHKDFKDDLQLLSLYLDSKIVSKKHIEGYMEDHPEIKDMLGDYIQSILLLKPEDVFEFTAKYFLAFTPSLLPQSEYFEQPHDDDEAAEEDYEFWKYI